MSIELIIIGCLGVSILIFLMQCIIQLGMKIDAGLVFGFCFFFELTGFLYKTYIQGSTLFLLLAFPLALIGIAFLHKPKLSEDLWNNHGLRLWYIFIGYSIVSVSWAFNDSLGLYKLQELFIHGIIPGLFIFILYKKYRTFSWTSVLIFGLGFAIVHQLFAMYALEYPGRLTLPGGNPIYDARLLFVAVTIAIWGKRIPLLLRLAAIGFGMVSGIATQSRGPLLALIAANLIVLLYVLYKRHRSNPIQFSNGLKAGALIAVIIVGFVGWQFKTQIQQSIGGSRYTVLVNQTQMTGDPNFQGRKYLQLAALDRFIQFPLFGTGLGGESIMGKKNYPHNIILEIASELGLVGITLWLIAFLYSCFIARHSAIWLALLFQTLISALFSGDFGANYEYILVAITALALAPKRKVEDSGEHEKNQFYSYKHGLRRGTGAGRAIGKRPAT